MYRLMVTRLSIIAVVMLMGLLAPSAVLAGDWWWNAQLNVQGTEVHLKWSVDGQNPDQYQTTIGLSYPQGADIALVSKLSDKEHVYLMPSRQLAITSQGVQVQADFRIVPVSGADGQTVSVSIVLGNGQVIASGQGALRDSIVLSAVVPTN